MTLKTDCFIHMVQGHLMVIDAQSTFILTRTCAVVNEEKQTMLCNVVWSGPETFSDTKSFHKVGIRLKEVTPDRERRRIVLAPLNWESNRARAVLDVVGYVMQCWWIQCCQRRASRKGSQLMSASETRVVRNTIGWGRNHRHKVVPLGQRPHESTQPDAKCVANEARLILRGWLQSRTLNHWHATSTKWGGRRKNKKTTTTGYHMKPMVSLR